MFVAVLVAVLIANGVSAEHVQVLAKAGNGEKIPIDITVQDGSVITESGQPYPPQPFFRQSTNLYDFDRHLEARKVTEEGRCYIRMFRGSYGQMKKVVDAAKSINSKMTTKASEDWNIPGKEIKDGELKATVGAKIAEFCSKYRVFWVNQNKKVTKLQVRMTKRQWKFSKGRLNYNNGKGFKAHIGPTWKYGGPAVKGGLKYNNGKGFSANLGGTWNHKGSSVNGGLKYNFGKGFSAHAGGSWNRGGGLSASAGLKWTFG